MGKRENPLLPVYEAAHQLAKKHKTDPGQVFTRSFGEGWAIAVNLAKIEKRATYGALSMGVGIKPKAVAVWHRDWLVAVIMESGGTFLPRDKDSSAAAMLDALKAALAAKEGAE